jgi:hypothetical protein
MDNAHMCSASVFPLCHRRSSNLNLLEVLDSTVWSYPTSSIRLIGAIQPAQKSVHQAIRQLSCALTQISTALPSILSCQPAKGEAC